MRAALQVGRPALACLACLAAGCFTDHRRQLQAAVGPGVAYRPDPQVVRSYRLAPRDVIEVSRGRAASRVTVALDGSLPLGPVGDVPAAGRTAGEVQAELARRAGLPLTDIGVRVAAHRGRTVSVFGPIKDGTRTLPYVGPETVLEVLQRAGGLGSGANLRKIHLVRPRVADGRPPEVFQIDLEKVILRQDSSTNVRVRPGDHVYVSETRRSLVEKMIPPVLKPAYQAVCLFCPKFNGLQRRP